MKLFIFTGLFAFLAVLPMKAFSSFSVMEVEDKKDIKLDGNTEDDNPKSLVLPFGAYQEDNQEVCVVSYNICPSVTIRIIDAYGNTMDSLDSSLSSLQVTTFDISGYAVGIYTLVIATPQGTYLTGVFEVE